MGGRTGGGIAELRGGGWGFVRWTWEFYWNVEVPGLLFLLIGGLRCLRETKSIRPRSNITQKSR